MPSHEPLKPDGGFQLVLKHKYLALIALLILLSNIVNTTGEFILSKSVAEHAKALSAASANASLSQQEYIGKFYSDFYFWVNLVGAGLQMFMVSRVMRRAGVGRALLFVPTVALAGYSLLSVAPILGLIRGVKIAENGTDYSLQNTARQALFLKTSRESKYQAKMAIDSFFWRVGDAFSALIVFVGTRLAFDVSGFARMNTIFTTGWLCVAAAIVRFRMRVGESELRQ